MNTREAIRLNLDQADNIVRMYVADLSDAELLVRPVPGCNHIAWQMGHLIQSEYEMVNTAYPGSMPPLPEGFAARYAKETSLVDDPKAFHTKQEFLDLYSKQRAATLAALEKVSDSEFDKPAPEEFRSYLRSIGDLFSLQGTHWTMHAGQWAVIRRKLGRKPLF